MSPQFLSASFLLLNALNGPRTSIRVIERLKRFERFLSYSSLYGAWCRVGPGYVLASFNGFIPKEGVLRP
jgi:hypothetical protein